MQETKFKDVRFSFMLGDIYCVGCDEMRDDTKPQRKDALSLVLLRFFLALLFSSFAMKKWTQIIIVSEVSFVYARKAPDGLERDA